MIEIRPITQVAEVIPVRQEPTILVDQAEDAMLFSHYTQLRALLAQTLHQPPAIAANVRPAYFVEVYPDPIDFCEINEHRISHITTIYGILGTNAEATLEDGSIWQMSDTFNANLRWSPSDRISIRPSIYAQWPWNSSYTYEFKNEVTGDIVPAKPSLIGPQVYGPHSHWVTAVDRFYGYVYLENGSKWKVSFWEEAKLSNWTVGDHVIIGDNPDSYFNDSIIINYNTNQYIKGHETVF